MGRFLRKIREAAEGDSAQEASRVRRVVRRTRRGKFARLKVGSVGAQQAVGAAGVGDISRQEAAEIVKEARARKKEARARKYGIGALRNRKRAESRIFRRRLSKKREDQLDQAAIEAARDQKTIPWEQFKAKLGL